jgi:hypothetical protein
MAQTAFTGAYILRSVVDVPRMALAADRFERIVDQRRLRSGKMTQLTRSFDWTGVPDVDSVRHDQIAPDGPGKCRGRVLAMAQEALLCGLAWVPACREELLMTAQTLTWRDLGQ